jgi:methane/ammonia monooxygenase subunit B
VLETWPEQLADPKLGFIGLVAPGPVVLIKERKINGVPAPHAIDIKKGGVYQFEMTLVARRPGHWHIHPIFGVHGAGSLLGPGQYVTVKESASGFSNNIQLTNGKTVDLENFGIGGLWFWSIVWLVMGLIWLLYWIVPKRTVTRLPVTSQIPLNTDGQEYGLITKKDHRVMNILMLVTLLLLAGGWIYQSSAYPDKMTQQVLRFEPPAADADPIFVTAKVTDAQFQPKDDTLTFDVEVTNQGEKAATLNAFTTTTLTWAADKTLQVSPSTTIAPGETKTLTLAIKDKVWTKERLMPLNESRLQLTGVLRFADEAAAENFVTIQSFVRPIRG